MNFCSKCGCTLGMGNCLECRKERDFKELPFKSASNTVPIKDDDKIATLLNINEDLLEALKYVKRFLKPKEVDMEYIDDTIKKAEGLQNV